MFGVKSYLTLIAVTSAVIALALRRSQRLAFVVASEYLAAVAAWLLLAAIVRHLSRLDTVADYLSFAAVQAVGWCVGEFWRRSRDR